MRLRFANRTYDRLSVLQTAGGERIDFVYDVGGDLAEIRNRAGGADVTAIRWAKSWDR